MGDFLYIHYEANPRWYHYFDRQGNQVLHGGRGDSTDATVRILKASREKLEPRLMAYLKDLLARHGEELHEEGRKQFKAVTIWLPHKMLRRPDLEVTVHTGSGCYYDQDEIAYEMMAALSGLPTFKMLAWKFCGRFERQDDIHDQTDVRYHSCESNVTVSFAHSDSEAPVVISMNLGTPEQLRTNFVSFMCKKLSAYVEEATKKQFVAESGCREYSSDDGQTVLRIGATIEDLTFSVVAT